MKSQRGITLIALIITIIVLLILAGVTISIVVGDNGILTQAGRAKDETEKNDEKDRLSIAYNSAMSNKLGERVTANDLNEEFEVEQLDATAKGIDPILVTFNESGRIYEIKSGQITEVEKVYLQEGEWTYTIDNVTNTAVITKCNIVGATEIIIPNFVKVNDVDIPVIKLSADWIGGVESIWSDTTIANQYSPSRYNVDYPKQETITKIIVSEGIEEIDGPVFAGTENLEEIILPDSLKRFGGSGVFAWCTNLNTIVIPNNVTYIVDSTFWYCLNLTEITIPDNVIEMGNDIFYSCSSLKNIIISKTLTRIGSSSFFGCEQLQNVYYKGSQSKWNAITIGTENTLLTSATIQYNYSN